MGSIARSEGKLILEGRLLFPRDGRCGVYVDSFCLVDHMREQFPRAKASDATAENYRVTIERIDAVDGEGE